VVDALLLELSEGPEVDELIGLDVAVTLDKQQ
jgi:hypothetical protein